MDFKLAWLIYRAIQNLYLLNNQLCMNGPTTLIDLNPDECNQGLCYYSFMLNLDRCNRNCNTLNESSNRICVPNKAEDVNLNDFNLITKINV